MLPIQPMQLFKSLKIFWGLPAVDCCGITVASHHCIRINAVQLKRLLSKLPAKHIAVLCFIFIIAQKTNAQTADTNYVDTASMQNTDSSSVGYDDEDDGYVDTTVQHIYDTSQYFFNTKDNTDDPFIKEKIAQRHLIDADVSALKTQDDFWYIPAIEKLELRLKNDPKFRDSLLNAKNHELNDEDKNSFTQQTWFTTLVWVIVIGVFVAAVIYFLLQNKINLFSKESSSSTGDVDNEEHGDIFSLSYSKLIQKAEKEKDYRVAIRLMFLETLKLLSQTNSIQYQADFTNLHYLQQLHQTKFYNEFLKATHNYEYVWYGKFDISNEQYIAIRNDFLRLQHKII